MLVQALPKLGGIVKWNILKVPKSVQKAGRVTWSEFLGARKLRFQLEWNEFGKFWVLSVWKDEVELVRTALQYGWDAFESFQHIPELRGLMLVPFDPGLSCTEEGITRNNLGREVQLFWVSYGA